MYGKMSKQENVIMASIHNVMLTYEAINRMESWQNGKLSFHHVPTQSSKPESQNVKISYS